MEEDKLIAIIKIPTTTTATLPSSLKTPQGQSKIEAPSPAPSHIPIPLKSPAVASLTSPSASDLNMNKQKLVDELEVELGIIERSKGRGSIRLPHHNNNAKKAHETIIDHHVSLTSNHEDDHARDEDAGDEINLAETGRSRSVHFDDTVTENSNQHCSMFKRPYPNVKFFLFAFILGFILSLFGVIVVFHQHSEQFGFYYTIGSIISVIGTIFLAAPGKQIANLHLTFPAISVVVIILAFLLSFVCVFNLQYPDGAVMLFVVQYMTLSCYSIFYIPSAISKINSMWTAIENSN